MPDYLAALRRNAKKQDDALEERDALIVNAKEAGVPVTHIAEAAGLSRAHVHRIVAQYARLSPEEVEEVLQEDEQSSDPIVRLSAKLSRIPGMGDWAREQNAMHDDQN